MALHGDLVGTVRRALRKPPSYLARRALQEAARASDRWRAPGRATGLTPARLASRLGYADIDQAWDALLARPYPFVPQGLTAQALDRLAPGESARILADAEDALAHRVDLMGSGPVELGAEIDWHTDAKTGRRWPPAYCHGIDYTNLDQPSDVKFPWELSRMQWLIPAAQGYLLTGEERYAAGVREVLQQWIAANPYAGSVNWSCTMEPALRILTFSWFFHALGRSEAFADSSFRGAFLRSLYLHGDFTDRYIERSDVNGNHYTADAAGLVFAGLFFGDAPEPRRWVETGWTTLAEEIEKQVFSDGVDFEASVPYHRLVGELFALPAIYGAAIGRQVPDLWRERLVAMGRFTAAYSRADGSVPIWGDADDARALPMAGKSLNDHRYLLGVIGVGVGSEELLSGVSGPFGELAWLFGPEAAAGLANREPPPARTVAFPQGGFYVLGQGQDHVFIDCGPLGLAGRGGHGHNDLMSFEAALGGQRLVIDPGCYLYTASPQERNAFRSTAYHNTPQVAGAEINRFIRPDYLWSLHNDAEPQVLSWAPDEGGGEILMAHTGYQRLDSPVRPIRRITLRPGELTVEDRFEGCGHPVAIPFHLAPEVEVLNGGEDLCLRTPGGEFTVSWTCEGDWHLSVEPARVAPSYGAIQETRKLVWRSPDCAGARLSVAFRAPLQA